MKKIILFLGLIIVCFLFLGCASDEDRINFCKIKGYDSFIWYSFYSFDNRFYCVNIENNSVYDTSDISAKSCQMINIYDYPICSKWCNSKEEYQYNLCFTNCEVIKKECI